MAPEVAGPSVLRPECVFGVTMQGLRVSAPGRICLFGEHQDYLGLPVIAAAISLRIYADGRPADHARFGVRMGDIGDTADIDPNVDQQYASARDYLRSCVSVLRRRGVAWPQGYAVDIHGRIPIRAGVSSSSAMVIMWLRFLIETGVPPIHVGDEDLARLGHAAEVVEFGEPGGMMDHFCAAVGGLLAIDTKKPYGATSIPATLDGIVVGDSLEPKATIETLARARGQVSEGLRLVREHMPHFELAETPLAEAERALRAIPSEPARRLRANLLNRDLTQSALVALAGGDQAGLGRLLLQHHGQLRDGLDLSTPKVEAMLDAAMQAGALGGKINGSGGGGCMFAYAPGRVDDVAEAMRRVGGEPHIVTVDRGCVVHGRAEG
jgi:galactokinase